MAGIAVGTTAFVLGREVDGNREMYVFENGQSYDLDFEDVKAYSVDETEFPII
jgi:hypothetical protein